MNFVYDDGGRADAGYKGKTGDCVTRAIAIASGRSYDEVYDDLNDWAKTVKPSKKGRVDSARTGVRRKVYEPYLQCHGWLWTPTMLFAQGCTVHLRDGELPSGRLIVRLSRHMSAVIDGVIHDIYDPSRDGTRCCYGYFHHPMPLHILFPLPGKDS